MKRIFILSIFCFLFFITNEIFASFAWTRMADFGGKREQAFAFSIGNYGYAGTGKDPVERNDFWQYDPSLNVWTQKANYPGQGRYALVGFAIGNYGYAGTGWSGPGGPGNQYNDFWRYDPSNNTWNSRTDFGGQGRYSAVGFTIGNKGYVGLGHTPLLRDFWEYDPVTDQWLQRANFPSLRQAAVGIGVGNYGYVGTGYNSGLSYRDWYQFDPVNNTWTQKADMPGLLRRGAIAFAIGNAAYVGMGYNDTTYLTDFAKYDPLTDQWSTVASIGGVPRYLAFAFSLNGYGYVGTGSYGGIVTVIQTSDFWRFEDCDGTSVGMQVQPQIYSDSYVSVRSDFHNGIIIEYDLGLEKGNLILYDALGKIVLSTELPAGGSNKTVKADLSSDVYFYSVKNNERIVNSGKMVVF